MSRYYDYLYIFATIAFTVYGQLIIKVRIANFGGFPETSTEKLKFLGSLFLDPGILSGFFAAFIASLTWMAAMTKFELSFAYPFMSLNFVIVMLLSAWLLSEPINLTRILGVALIVIGTIISSNG